MSSSNVIEPIRSPNSLNRPTMFIPSMRSVTYRHPSPSDLNAITDVLNKSRAEIPFYPALAPEELNIETFLDADYDLNGVWLAFVDGRMGGYAHGLVEKARLAAGVGDGWGSVGGG